MWSGLWTAGSSVRVRLLAAYSLVAGMTVIAAGVGILSHRDLAVTINAFGNQTIPALMASQQMLEISSHLVATTQSLGRATDDQEREMLRHQAELDLRQLQETLAMVRAQVQPQTIAEQIGQVLSTFAPNLAEVDTGAATLLSAVTLRGQQVNKVNAVRDAALAAADPMVRSMKTSLTVKIGSLASAADMTEVQEAVDNMDGEEISRLITAQSLQTGISNLHALLISSASASSTEALGALEPQIELALRQLAQVKLLPSNETVTKFRRAADEMAALSGGPNSVVKGRAQEIEARRAVERAVERNAAIAQQLSTAVRSLADNQTAAVTGSIISTGHGIQRDLWTFAGLGAVSIIMALLVGWLYVSRSLMRRIIRLRDAMLGIAAGQLRTPISTDGHDEITAMANALAVFRDNAFAVEALRLEQEREREAGERHRREALLTMAADLEGNAGPLLAEVMTAADRLRMTAETLSITADGANSRTESVSAASVQTTGNVQTVAAATEQLSASIKEIARQVATSTTLSHEAEAEAAGTEKLVSSLRDASVRIGAVLSLISDIASKTNLLALNATIEAARAGEAGRGFSVVASEVKALATQTANATKEIASHIASMQQVSENSGLAIAKIATIVGRMNEIGVSIAASVEEQTAATDEIVRNVDAAAEKIASVDEGISGVRQAASDTRAASSEVLVSANALSADAQRLEREVSNFLANVRAA